MTILQVIYFITVAKCGTITAAAEKLYISQPALSLQLQSLERELDCALLKRQPRGIKLTAAGKTFLEAALPLEADWIRLNDACGRLKSSICSQIRIGFGPRAFSNDLVGPVISFFSEYSDTDVSVVTDIGDNTLDALVENRIDMAIDRLPPVSLIKHPEKYYSKKLLSERQCVILAPSNEHMEEFFPITELNGKTVITGPEGSQDDLTMKNVFSVYSIKPKRHYRADSLPSIVSMIKNGKGLTLGPASFAKQYNLLAVPIVPQTDIDLCLITLNTDKDNATVLSLIKFLEKHISGAEK